MRCIKVGFYEFYEFISYSAWLKILYLFSKNFYKQIIVQGSEQYTFKILALKRIKITYQI